MSKKVIVLSLLFCSAALLSSQTKPVNTSRNVPTVGKKSLSFHHISMVSFKNKATFTIGENVQTFTAERTVAPFAINKFETTYALWYKTRLNAEKIGYNFVNKGMPGSSGKVGAPPNEKNACQPVTMVNWYDAIVWCNALSELKGLTPCYTFEGEVLRDSSDARCDLAECNWKANGYRLPSEAEWEYASRRTKYGLQAGDLVSGQIDAEGKSNPERDYSQLVWDAFNSQGTKPVGIAGAFFSPDDVPLSGTGIANGAGLFDMCGNALEFVWDWFAEYNESKTAYGPKVGMMRVSRGGSFSEYTPFLYCGDRYSYDPNEAYEYTGFRIAQTVTNSKR